MNFEELYNNVCGYYANSNIHLNVFEKGKECAILVKQAYDLRLKIENRLCSEEDMDLLELINLYEEMQKEVAFKIYSFYENNI